MTISLYYNFISEIKSQLIAVTIVRNYYRIEWHYLDSEGRINDDFYQYYPLTTEEFTELVKDLEVLFEKEGVPLWLIDILKNQINYD